MNPCPQNFSEKRILSPKTGCSDSTPDLIHQIELGEAELWIWDAEDSKESSGPESRSSAGHGILAGTRTQSECGESTAETQEPTAHRGIHAQDAVHPWGKLSQRPDLATHQRFPIGRCHRQCSDGDKRFSNLSALTQHQRMHTGEQPLCCADCGKSFAESSKLSRQRTHTREQTYQCTNCGKSFAHNSSLTVHQRTHTGEQPHHCTNCGKGFSQIGHLRIHERTHTGERPHQCTKCGKSFAHNSSLRVHQHAHTREQPNSCHNCSKNFGSAHAVTKSEHAHWGAAIPMHCLQQKLCTQLAPKNTPAHSSRGAALQLC
uniref:C2H2-type domain-containing protein n=1 Tax=Gopherus evgoodei TaxID=1825980 RepID=A0A8C4XW88_9SAUR